LLERTNDLIGSSHIFKTKDLFAMVNVLRNKDDSTYIAILVKSSGSP